VTETVGAPVAVPVEPVIGTRSVRIVTMRREAAAPAVRTVSRSTKSTTVRPRAVRRSAAVRPARSVHHLHAAAPRVRATRTITTKRVVGQPLVLSPPQRRVIYQNILQQQVLAAPATTEVLTYPPVPSIIQPGAVTGYAVPYPGQVVPTYAPAAYASATYPVTYSVGATIPTTVSLAPVPETVLMQVPQVRPYSYAVVNNRVLLVDPATGIVVADVTP
jgi:hypothetical protein